MTFLTEDHLARLQAMLNSWDACQPDYQRHLSNACEWFFHTTVPALVAEVQSARQYIENIRQSLPFSLEWADEHKRDDHVVTLDHKDERDLARFVEEVCLALDAYDSHLSQPHPTIKDKNHV